MIKSFLVFFLFTICSITMIRDFLYFKIDNLICILCALGGIFYTFFGYSEMSFLTAFYASIGILLVGFILNLLSIIGAGDVKFLAALILWIKPTQWAGFFITMSLLGTILCVIELGFAKKLRFFRLFIQKTIKKGKILNKFTFFLRDFNKYPSHLSIWEKPVPYGIAIAGAGLWQLS